MNLAENLIRSAELYPERVAVRLDDTTLTFAQLDEGSQRVAHLLAERGVGPGDRVGVMLPNVPEWAVLYYGVLRTGAVVVPMNPLLKAREVAHYLGDSGAGLVFVWEAAGAEAQAGAQETGAGCLVVSPGALGDLLAGSPPVPGVVDRDPSDTAVILYTSGTTGQPKGAELTHANLTSNVEASRRLMLDESGDHVVFGGLPLFHVFGQTCGLNVAVSSGSPLTLLARFDPDKALRIIERDRVTVFQGVPTMYAALANHPGADGYDTSSLRICASGGAALPGEVINDFEKRFPGSTILEGYGLSETSPVVSFNLPGKRRVGSIGVPIDGVEMRIVDDKGAEVAVGEVGEIAVRGHNVMKGYWGRPEATEAAIVDGWFHTGDIGRTDEDGFFFVVDRKKEMIIRGGYNIYPREIEEVLYEHPDVVEAAVLGMPHRELGEEVGAAVALRPGATVSPEELRDYVKARVAAYKYPRLVRIMDELPKGPTGKIHKLAITLQP